MGAGARFFTLPWFWDDMVMLWVVVGGRYVLMSI